jgi:hypothetical protein
MRIWAQNDLIMEKKFEDQFFKKITISIHSILMENVQ